VPAINVTALVHEFGIDKLGPHPDFTVMSIYRQLLSFCVIALCDQHVAVELCLNCCQS
jgi:hypothetical protein